MDGAAGQTGDTTMNDEEKWQKVEDAWVVIAHAFPEGSNAVSDKALYELYFLIQDMKEMEETQ